MRPTHPGLAGFPTSSTLHLTRANRARAAEGASMSLEYMRPTYGPPWVGSQDCGHPARRPYRRAAVVRQFSPPRQSIELIRQGTPAEACDKHDNATLRGPRGHEARKLLRYNGFSSQRRRLRISAPMLMPREPPDAVVLAATGADGGGGGAARTSARMTRIIHLFRAPRIIWSPAA